MQRSAGLTATKPKLWLMKADDGMSSFKCTSDINDVRLSCECSCLDCKATYNAYIDEKAMTKVLQQRLDESIMENSYMIEQIKAMEDRYNAKIEELQNEVADKQRKMDFINAQLETERRLRMEEIYKLEFQKDENEKQATELRNTRKELVIAINALPELEHENNLLKQKVQHNESTISRINDDIEQYNYELAKMEDANTRLRMRLHDTDVQITHLKVNSKSSNNHTSSNLLLRPIKSMRTTNVPMSRSLAM